MDFFPKITISLAEWQANELHFQKTKNTGIDSRKFIGS